MKLQAGKKVPQQKLPESYTGGDSGETDHLIPEQIDH
jgi:hypothetical protein